MLDLQSPQELPDNLRGEQWNFVQLPLSALLEELSQVKQVHLLITLHAVLSLLVLHCWCCTLSVFSEQSDDTAA